MIQGIQASISADSRETTGAQTPADALGVTKRMSSLEDSSNQSDDPVCPACGKTFGTTGGMKVHYTRYCDESDGESIAGVVVECATCGSKKRIEPNAAERSENHFCNKSCESEWRKEHGNGENNPHWRGGKVIRSCLACGAEVEKYPSRAERTTGDFCNYDCWSEWASENRVGESSPTWKGGYAGRYGSSWLLSRRQARERDDYRCQGCGLSESDHIETFGQGLHVHHIQPFRRYGVENHEEANQLDNLVTLCRPCHDRWEGIPLRPEATNN